jgi:hypothetical protein
MRMQKVASSLIAAAVIICSVVSVTLHAQSHVEQRRSVHSINAPMGVPDPVGHYNLRVNVIRQQEVGSSRYDLSGHFGYGLFEWGGVHLRSLGARTSPLTEVIGMVGVLNSEDRTEGLSVLGILGIPTGEKDAEQHHGLSYLVGIAGRWRIGSVVVNDAVFHYDATAGHWIAESGTIVEISSFFFGVIDARLTFGGAAPEILVLPAMKVRVSRSMSAAIGYHAPLSRSKPFGHQLLVQWEMSHH